LPFGKDKKGVFGEQKPGFAAALTEKPGFSLENEKETLQPPFQGVTYAQDNYFGTKEVWDIGKETRFFGKNPVSLLPKKGDMR